MFYQLFSAADFRSALEDVVSVGGDTHAAIAWALPALMCVGRGLIPRPMLVCVRAVNARCYTALLPKRELDKSLVGLRRVESYSLCALFFNEFWFYS